MSCWLFLEAWWYLVTTFAYRFSLCSSLFSGWYCTNTRLEAENSNTFVLCTAFERTYSTSGKRWITCMDLHHLSSTLSYQWIASYAIEMAKCNFQIHLSVGAQRVDDFLDCLSHWKYALARYYTLYAGANNNNFGD